jgi:hypothetical protein
LNDTPDDSCGEEFPFLTVTVEPTNGVAAVIGVAPDLKIKFTPKTGFVGSDLIKYKFATPGACPDNSNEATVSITVTRSRMSGPITIPENAVDPNIAFAFVSDTLGDLAAGQGIRNVPATPTTTFGTSADFVTTLATINAQVLTLDSNIAALAATGTVSANFQTSNGAPFSFPNGSPANGAAVNEPITTTEGFINRLRRGTGGN